MAQVGGGGVSDINQHVALIHNIFQINKICIRKYIFQTGQMFECKSQKKDKQREDNMYHSPFF
jgi:hypothetical protein